MAITYKQEVQLYSVEQVTECSQAYGNDGCNGGQVYFVWDYLQ